MHNMMNFLKNKTVLGVVAAVVVAGLCYYLYTSTGQGALLSETNGSTSPVSQQILTTLGQLRAVQLNPALFSEPVFTSLSDFGVTIPPQQAGRRNPFAPVGSGGASTPQTGTTTPAR